MLVFPVYLYRSSYRVLFSLCSFSTANNFENCTGLVRNILTPASKALSRSLLLASAVKAIMFAVSAAGKPRSFSRLRMCRVASKPSMIGIERSASRLVENCRFQKERNAYIPIKIISNPSGRCCTFPRASAPSIACAQFR
jgi:hypothetical protein